MKTLKSSQLTEILRIKYDLERQGKLNQTIEAGLDIAISNLYDEIHKPRQLKAEKTRFKVTFPSNGKVIFCNTAKETYKQVINEFGLNVVKSNFPQFFLQQRKANTDCLFLNPNTYLKTGLSNNAKVRNIDRIARVLKSPVIVMQF